jgi:signal transduction histidine kinase
MLLDGIGRERETPLLAGDGRGVTAMRLHRGSASARQRGGARRRLLPRRTVRLRLTVMYGVLFFVCGALLLALADSVTVHASFAGSGSGLGRAPTPIQHLNGGPSAPQVQPSLSHQLFMASLIALGVMTVVALALGWIMAGRALRPVREMTAAAQRISEENLHERLALTGPDDELKELGDTMDGLLARLEGAFAAQRRFVANASHELRTPLTTMRASLDVAVAKPEPVPPQTAALAARLRAELDKIDALLEAFLVLARAQHRHLPGSSALPLDYVVGAALADQGAAIEAMNLTVQDISEPGGAWVVGNQALLSLLVGNVIGNAVRHNADRGWIKITTQTDGRRVSLIVENGGQVLEQREVDELAQPFRRLGADRTGSDKGWGLGLSIVAAIAEAHGGTLDLQAREDGGLRICVQLPSAAARPPAPKAGVPA